MKIIGLRAATWLLRFVPRGVAVAVAGVVGDLCWLTMRARRRVIADNLARTAANRTARERRRLGRATFRHIASSTVDFLRLPLMSRQALIDLIEFQGREHLDAALAHGKGAIIVSGHIGGWELSGPLVAAHGYGIHGYVEDTGVDPEVLRAYARYRGAMGLSALPVTRGARVGYHVLERGEILGMLADRVIVGRGLPVTIGRGSREIPIGPAALARWSGAPILFGHMILTPNGERPYRAVLEPIAQSPSDDDEAVTRSMARRLSHVIEEYPDQWFVFQPQWLAPEPPQG